MIVLCKNKYPKTLEKINKIFPFFFFFFYQLCLTNCDCLLGSKKGKSIFTLFFQCARHVLEVIPMFDQFVWNAKGEGEKKLPVVLRVWNALVG